MDVGEPWGREQDRRGGPHNPYAHFGQRGRGAGGGASPTFLTPILGQRIGGSHAWEDPVMQGVGLDRGEDQGMRETRYQGRAQGSDLSMEMDAEAGQRQGNQPSLLPVAPPQAQHFPKLEGLQGMRWEPIRDPPKPAPTTGGILKQGKFGAGMRMRGHQFLGGF